MSGCGDNLAAIQGFLQHRNIETTRRYVHANFSATAKEFDRLSREELSNVRRELDDKTNKT